MRWNPVNYGEIKEMRVAPDKVWLPDIVLFNKWVSIPRLHYNIAVSASKIC